jgi:hypothetical protein
LSSCSRRAGLGVVELVDFDNQFVWDELYIPAVIGIGASHRFLELARITQQTVASTIHYAVRLQT